MTPSGIVTLTSDFGNRDSFVAEVKGAILSRAPAARIVDVTHEVRPFDVRQGGFQLMCAAAAFPRGTVHVAVVDPGVGAARLPLAIRTRRSWLVGPDNGLLAPAARAEGIVQARRIRGSGSVSAPVSRTFHGRDLFAPAAAALLRRGDRARIGPTVRRIAPAPWREAARSRGGFEAEVVACDRFGNVVTSLRSDAVPRGTRALRVTAGRRSWKCALVRAFGEARSAAPSALRGSHGLIEIVVREGDAARRTGLAPGRRLTLRSLRA